jgi:NAD(P)-dependent dehydrogenase (short-subunit alcohol dehydrogenase family)
VRRLSAGSYDVDALSRNGTSPTIDITDEESVASAVKALKDNAPYNLIVVATGILHDAEVAPEKAIRDASPVGLLHYFNVNAVGPALVAKHFISLLHKAERSIFAVLSARVGSISDNRLGGWYGYRASKAALNMLIKTLSIEVRRTRPAAICVALHPGTVDSRLSKPYQHGVASDRLFSPDDAASKLLAVIERLAAEQSGNCFDWEGVRILP